MDDVLPTCRACEAAGLAGLITLALTVDHGRPAHRARRAKRLTLEFRFGDVLMAVVLVFFGRVALGCSRSRALPAYGLGIGGC